MNISEYLKEKQICLGIKSGEKKAVIKELANFLRGAKEITDYKAFLKDVFKREEIGSTGIGSGVAIPHARTGAVSELVIAFGRSTKGVEFKSLDNRPVKLIFLMGAPKQNVNEYLRILARLTRLLKKAAFRRSLIEASGTKEVIDIFRKAEQYKK